MGGDILEWTYATRIPAEGDVSASRMGVGEGRCALKLGSTVDVDTYNHQSDQEDKNAKCCN